MSAHAAVRACRGSDARACPVVIDRAVAEMAGLIRAARLLVTSRNVPAALDAELGQLYAVVCEMDGRCVGPGALDGTEIERVYVDPNAQGSGVGESIMNALESEARRRAVSHVQLAASPSSVSFYGDRGYVPAEEQRLVVDDAEFRVIPMTCDLTEPVPSPASGAGPASD